METIRLTFQFPVNLKNFGRSILCVVKLALRVVVSLCRNLKERCAE